MPNTSDIAAKLSRTDLRMRWQGSYPNNGPRRNNVPNLPPLEVVGRSNTAAIAAKKEAVDLRGTGTQARLSPQNVSYKPRSEVALTPSEKHDNKLKDRHRLSPVNVPQWPPIEVAPSPSEKSVNGQLIAG